MSFTDLGLDPRLLRALAKKGFERPTPVQSEAIPRVLEGRDVVARARTGSGKTMGYLLPAIQKLLASDLGKQGFQVLILAPTRELCEQVREEALAISEECGSEVMVTSLSKDMSAAAARHAISRAGQIVVATPGRIAQALSDGSLSTELLISRLHTLVLDEADLLLSYGYEEDLRLLAPQVPRSCQCILMSATSSEDVERLQKLVLHNPITLSLISLTGTSAQAEGDAEGTGPTTDIQHFSIHCSPDDRMLYMLALLKLALVRKKVLMFVNGLDEAFRLRLFLESFGIRPALLNAELPLNSRHHILQEFNKGLFDYLIATDDCQMGGPHGGGKTQRTPSAKAAKAKKRKRAASDQDHEFGVTRGIDFKGVKTVVNFQVPGSVVDYTHRVGRTGRGGHAGTAITLFTQQDAGFEREVEAQLRSVNGVRDSDATLSVSPAAHDAQGASQHSAVVQPFPRITPAAVEALRYRAEDVARSITKTHVQEARAAELRKEVMNSTRLQEHFEANPADLALLKHDKPLHCGTKLPHLKHLPSYLRDPTLAGKSYVGNKGRGVMQRGKRQRVKKSDPVKGFVRATKRGDADQELTEMEKEAMEAAKKERKKTGKKLDFVKKRNVRRGKGRKR